MTTVYVITRVLPYFGTLLRAFWEHLVCRICKIPAEDVSAFKNSELCGHVEHHIIYKRSDAFLMCYLPFVMNFILACCFLLTGSYRLFYLGDTTTYQAYIFIWLGISCAANCVPSFEDMLSFKDCVYGGKSIFLKVIFAPFFAVICAGACLEKYSLTFLLSIGFAVAFPHIFSIVFSVFDIVGALL